MKILLADTGSRLTVVMAPYRPQFDSQILSRDRSYVLRPQSMMAETCDDLGIRSLTFTLYWPRKAEPVFYETTII